MEVLRPARPIARTIIITIMRTMLKKGTLMKKTLMKMTLMKMTLMKMTLMKTTLMKTTLMKMTHQRRRKTEMIRSVIRKRSV